MTTHRVLPCRAAYGTSRHMTVIYKICPQSVWDEARPAGAFAGAGIDLVDGYIHFSTAEQAPETARLHFAGQSGLVLVAVDAALLGEALKWEPSRGGDLFPHLYGPLPLAAVTAVIPLPLGEDGVPQLPALDSEAGPDATSAPS